MVSSAITNAEGISGNISAIIHGQKTQGAITLEHFLDAFTEKGIHEDTLSLGVELNSGHGYNRSDLVGHYILNGTIKSVNIVYSEEEAQEKKIPSTSELTATAKPPKTYNVDIDCSELDKSQCQMTVYYDNSGNYRGSVSYPKALEKYCRAQADQKFKMLYTAQGGHARETTGKHVDKRT